MNTDLLRYLWMLYDMESSVYQQEELIRQLSSIDTTLPPLPPRDKGRPVFKLGKNGLTALRVGGIMSLIIAVVPIVCSSQNWSNIVATFLCVGGIRAIYESAARKTANEKEVAQWEIDNVRRRKYDTAVAKRRHIFNEIQLAKDKLSDSRQLLEQMYAKNIIYTKYRNLPAISSFLDYFSSGICTDLSGPYGAYSRYENDARMNAIITRLDRISMQLEQIQYNQQRLFEAVKACNETVNRLYHAVESSAAHLAGIAASQSQIAENTAMAAYRLKLIEKETAYRNLMEYGFNYL